MKTGVFLAVLGLTLMRCAEPKDLRPNGAVDLETAGFSVVQDPPDTLIKTGKPFMINGIKSYWTQYITDDDVVLVLKRHETSDVLVNTEIVRRAGIFEDFNEPDYFDKVSKEFLVDLNFDGWTDFHCPSLGSNGPMSDITLIFLFNPKTKSFDASDDLSTGVLRHIDARKRKLVIVSEYRRGSDSIVYQYDKTKSGKPKTVETFSRYSSLGENEAWFINAYTKLVDGTIVETKRDSTLME